MGVGVTVLVVILYFVLQLSGDDKGSQAHHRQALTLSSSYTQVAAPDPILFAQPARPPVLFLTYKSRDQVPEYVWERFRRYTEGFTIEFFDDDRSRSSLYPFGPTVLKKFDQLHGAHRADLWRYCMMYLHGGVYCDIKTVLQKQLGELVPDPYQNYTVLAWCTTKRYGESIHNAFLGLVPRNPVMMESILHVLDSRYPLWEYLEFCRFLHRALTVYLGPLKKGTIRDWTFYEEVMTSGKCDKAQRDRYGFCPLEWRDESDHVVALSRDPLYPWAKAPPHR